MKRIVYALVAIVIVLGIYHDITKGTLAEEKPVHNTVGNPEPPLPKSQEHDEEASYQEVIIEPGQTVLSIIEHLNNGQVDASIDSIISDFVELNDQVDPNALQIGQSYRFPIYAPE